MTTPLLEWNLGFAFDEVVEGVEQMCAMRSYIYTRTDRDSETCLSITLPSGMLELLVKPLLSHHSPFSPLIILHRTSLTVTSTAPVVLHDWEPFRQHVMLAFLRAGG